MSDRINDVLVEVQTKLGNITALQGRVTICYNENDLIDSIKGLRTFPAVGIVYEGMRSAGENKPTSRLGLSAEVSIGLILIEQGDSIIATQQKKTRAIDMLKAMRDEFMDERSTVTGHYWHFMVESPAELTSGMVCWVQRWSLPIQLPPPRP